MVLAERMAYPTSDIEFVAFSGLLKVADEIFDAIESFIPITLGLPANAIKVALGYFLAPRVTNKWLKLFLTALTIDGVGGFVEEPLRSVLGQVTGRIRGMTRVAPRVSSRYHLALRYAGRI